MKWQWDNRRPWPYRAICNHLLTKALRLVLVDCGFKAAATSRHPNCPFRAFNLPGDQCPNWNPIHAPFIPRTSGSHSGRSCKEWCSMGRSKASIWTEKEGLTRVDEEHAHEIRLVGHADILTSSQMAATRFCGGVTLFLWKSLDMFHRSPQVSRGSPWFDWLLSRYKLRNTADKGLTDRWRLHHRGVRVCKEDHCQFRKS